MYIGLDRVPFFGESVMSPAKRAVRVLLAATAGAFAFSGVSAQEPPPVRERVNVNAERREEPIRVQVGINLFFAGPTGESDDAVKLRDRARGSIYEMAANECSLIERVLAKTCRLESVNVNINRQVGAQNEGYIAGGNFVLRVTLK
jgi:hypothetical protein